MPLRSVRCTYIPIKRRSKHGADSEQALVEKLADFDFRVIRGVKHLA